MENQQPQDPIQQPLQTPVQIPDFQPKPNYLKTILFSILLIVTAGLISYLIFQNQKLQKQVLNPPVFPTIQIPTSTPQSVSPTPKTDSSISIPPDETAGWKTYKNTIDAFSLKYPSSWIYKEGSEGPEFAPSDKLFSTPYTEVFSPISIFIKTTDNFDLSNTSFNQYEEKPVTISEINTNRITGINKGTNTRITGVKFTHNGKIFIIVTFGNNYIQTFDQILSTFKFIDKLNEVDQGTVSGKLCYPSDFLPKGEIIAKDIVTGKLFSQDYPGSGNGGTENFTFKLPIGTYHLKYQAHASLNEPDKFISMYYTACATNNENNFCQSDANHTIINSVIKKNEESKGTALCDPGYSQSQEELMSNSF